MEIYGKTIKIINVWGLKRWKSQGDDRVNTIILVRWKLNMYMYEV